ncbi:MAG: phytanoyl-CoA dioxygenase family protein [Bacteroidota bacterium]
MKNLQAPYPVSEAQQAFFRERGYIKLKNVLPPVLIDRYRNEITHVVLERNPLLQKPMSERTTYEKAFVQVTNLWRQNEVVREFVFSEKLAGIAAQLMGVRGVRLYHDQALYKEPSGGITPWHADQYYWPLSNPNTCTVWVPLQATPLPLGPLAFSSRSHTVEIGRDLAISDESEQMIQESLAAQNFEYDEGPFDLGEVSYHYGWTFHRAGPNVSQIPRAVMTIIYMEDGIKVTDLTREEHHADRDAFLPGTKTGDPAATEMNPLLYRIS